jgi:hypothetical protein
MAVSGLARLTCGRLANIFFPLGHPLPYTYVDNQFGHAIRWIENEQKNVNENKFLRLEDPQNPSRKKRGFTYLGKQKRTDRQTDRRTGRDENRKKITDKQNNKIEEKK